MPRCRPVHLATIASGFLVFAFTSHAKTTNFLDRQRGVTIGGGLYQYYLPNDNRFDPIPDLLPTGTTATGTEDLFMVPGKIGIFMSASKVHFELYGRILRSFASNWQTAGTLVGTGTSAYEGIGVGVVAGVYFFQRPRFQMGFAMVGEYGTNNLKISYTPASGGSENLNLTSTFMLAGATFLTEVWLGSMWTLSLATGYHWGATQFYQLKTDGTLFGQTYSGSLRNNAGGQIPSQLGGFLAEATFRLAFP